MNALLRLTYTSRPYGQLDDAALEALLESSRSRNYTRGITGVLHFGNGSFLQVLEGPETEVITLYAKIAADPRHRNCVLLDIGLIEDRLFGSWSMGFISDSRRITYGYNELLDYRRVRHDRQEVSGLLEMLVEILRD